MNVVDLNLRVRELQLQNERLRNTLNSNRNLQSHRGKTIDFESKYKKALKQIYDVIQANKQLKEELDKLKTSRNKLDGSMADVRKQEIYKVYEVVLNEKNQLKEQTDNLEADKERYLAQIQALEAEVNILKDDKMYLAQQKQALEAKQIQIQEPGSKGQELQKVQIRMRQKQQQFHRTLQNYQQHHITLSNQSKKNEERVSELEQKLVQTDKNWRNRFEAKEIEFKEIRTNVRHEYQDQINSLRKEINSLKLLNTDLMTKLQTVEMDGRDGEDMTEYEMLMLNSIKQLRLQMQPLRRQIIQLQEQNSFEKEQAERERTQLQLKLYEYESNIQQYTMQIKNQEQKIIKLNETIKIHSDNQVIVKKLEEENRILGGRVIVLESKDLATENRRESGSRKLEENVLEFQTRVQMLLNEKENLANLKNVSIHQLVTLKAYVLQMDQKLKNANQQNEYATKKYKSYKQKYLNSVKQIKNHQVLQNTLKSKILGYDKLVQRLQSELQKNVNISEMEVIEMNSKTSQEIVQIQNFKKKYQSLKDKLILQEKYNKQQLQTVKLNYQTKIVDLTIKAEQISSLRKSIALYKEKNEQLQNQLSQRENEMLEVRLSMGKQSSMKSENQLSFQGQNRELISSLQQTIHRQQSQILKLQTQARSQQQTNRKRIQALERELHELSSEYNKIKLSSTTKYNTQKNTQQLSGQNKRLKNKISQLENEIILTRGKNNQEQSKNSYELQFRISNLQIEKNQLINRLQTQLSHKKRLQKQYTQSIAKVNQLDAELTQINLQNNRKIMQLKYQLNQKHSLVLNLQDQLKRLKTQQRANLQSSTILQSSVVHKEDHSACEGRIKRLERELENAQADNEQLRKKANEGSYTANSFNHELESLKHDKEEARLKIERLEKELNYIRNTFKVLEDEKYEANRTINTLKTQLSSIKLSHQDQVFEKDRILTQLKSRLQHTQHTAENWFRSQSQLEQTLQQKQRQVASLRSRLTSAEADIEKLNQTINQYNKEISTIKYNNESSHSAYAQQMEQLLQQKTRTLRKYEQQIQNLHQQIEIRNQQISVKTQGLMRVQRQLNEYMQVDEQVDRLKSSLMDRQSILTKNRFQISTYEQQNQRVKRQLSQLKQQVQRVRLESIHKDDEISSLRLQISTVTNRVSNQLKNDFIQQISDKQSQISKLTFQIQSLQSSYQNIQQQLNQTQQRQRKAQQELTFTKNQLLRTQQELNQITETLIKRQSQLNQINAQMAGLKFLQQEVNEKNLTINKLKGEIASIKIEITHLTQQIEYKESSIIRQNNQLKLLKLQLMNREEQSSRNQIDFRNVMMELQRLKANLEENQLGNQQKDININRLNGQLNKVRQQFRDLQEQIEQREQQWSNIQYELNQAKTQIMLVSDQLQGKDITITKLSNQTAFLKQQITRLNQQLVEKNQQINRINQQVFVQKMDYTNRTSEEVQSLSNQIFGLKRQLESTKHSIEDLEGQNRRLKIQLEGSRIKLNQQHNVYLYTEQDMSQLKEENSKKYRQIMQLQFELSQHTSQNEMLRQRGQIIENDLNGKNQQIPLLEKKIQKLEYLLKQMQEQHQYNNENLQSQIQQFVETQRNLRYQIQQQQLHQIQGQQLGQVQQQQYNNLRQERQYNQIQERQLGQINETIQELKFGLKLYTQENDRLKLLNEQLVQEVNGLRLKLSEFHNQEDRIQQNLITMVLSFAQMQALRERVKNKQIQIKEVRKSFIQAISSGGDVQSQLAFESSKLVSMANQNHEENIRTLQDVMSQNSASIINYKSEVGDQQGQRVKEICQFEMRSQQGQQAYDKQTRANNKNNNNVQRQSLDGQSNNLLKGGQDNHLVEHQHQHQLSKPQYVNIDPQHETNNQPQQQYEVDLPKPRFSEESVEPHEASHHLAELNQLREYDHDQEVATSQVNQIYLTNNQITPQESITVLTHNQVTTIYPQSPQVINSQPPQVINTQLPQVIHTQTSHQVINPQPHQVINTQQSQVINTQPYQPISSQQYQRARNVNITFQGTSSQVQTASSLDINQQRISSSHFQTPSGASYVRITSNQPRVPIQQPNVVHVPPGMYVPQGMNIAPIRQPIPMSQSIPQQVNRMIVGGQIQQGHQVVTGSFPQSPQNLRY